MSAVHGNQGPSQFRTPAYDPNVFMDAEWAKKRQRVINEMYNHDIPLFGYNGSNDPWDTRNARTLPSMDPYVAHLYKPRDSNTGIGPWRRDTPMGPRFTAKELNYVGPYLRTGYNFAASPSVGLTSPKLSQGKLDGSTRLGVVGHS